MAMPLTPHWQVALQRMPKHQRGIAGHLAIVAVRAGNGGAGEVYTSPCTAPVGNDVTELEGLADVHRSSTVEKLSRYCQTAVDGCRL